MARKAASSLTLTLTDIYLQLGSMTASLAHTLVDVPAILQIARPFSRPGTFKSALATGFGRDELRPSIEGSSLSAG